MSYTIAKITNLARAIEVAIANDKRDKPQHTDSWDKAQELVSDYLYKGAGFDKGFTLSEEQTKPDKIVVHTSFHHMDDHGYYDGWTEHKITITPSLAFSFDVKVSGKNKNGIKDYIHECVYNWLSDTVTL